MNRPGWIKLYNQTIDSDFWADPEPFSLRDAFLHILISANWKEGVSRRNGRKVVIRRGQCLTSIRKLMSTFHWSKNRVYRWLKAMKDYEMLDAENLGFGTLLTVVNYDKFQLCQDTVGHTDGHMDGHANEDTVGHTDGHEVGTRSKTIDIRQQTTDSQSPAPAGTPPADKPEPPIGSKEWYALHYDD